uniref:Lipoprotein n=1 Tax=Strongyloides papillosus TaxID=174720 RepID=A0A0N5C015_STREA
MIKIIFLMSKLFFYFLVFFINVCILVICETDSKDLYTLKYTYETSNGIKTDGNIKGLPMTNDKILAGMNFVISPIIVFKLPLLKNNYKNGY